MMGLGRCRDLETGNCQSVASAQCLPRFLESTINPPSRALGHVLLEQANPCRDSDSYASCSFDCLMVSMGLFIGLCPIKTLFL